MIKDDLKKEAWRIAESCLRKLDPRSHGILHIKKVHGFFGFLRNNVKPTKINQEIMKSLEYAVILHDIGNRDTREGHGPRAIEILKEEFPDFYSKLPNRKWIEYAIMNHSKGERKNPKTPEQLCLSYLILLDNMDGIGKEGGKRIGRCIVKELGKPLKMVPGDNNNSVFEGLLFNHQWINGNINRIKGYVSPKFKKEYNRLKRENEGIIVEIVKKELTHEKSSNF